MKPGVVDLRIPFNPNAVWLYLSLYLLMPIAPLLMQEREDLLRYARGIVAATIVAAIVFIFWPTLCPRPSGNSNAAYQLLTAIDRPLHAFPSLHACFAVYSALYARFPFRWLWVALICYGALATKQHMLVDLIAGSLLGLMAYAFAFRSLNPPFRNIHENKQTTYCRGL